MKDNIYVPTTQVAPAAVVSTNGAESNMTGGADPTPDELRAIARKARDSSGSASDDCGPSAYVLYGWRAAMSKGPSIEDLCSRIKAADDLNNWLSTLCYVLGVSEGMWTPQEYCRALLDKIASWPLVGADAIKSAASAKAREALAAAPTPAAQTDSGN